MQEPQEQEVTFTRQNSEQKRGAQAWENIKAIKKLDEITKKDKKLEKEYRSLARGLNAMIQINGLGQTLGFLKAKGNEKKPHYHLLLTHLTEWMRETSHFRVDNSGAMQDRNDGLLMWIIDPDTSNDDYRRATTECLAFGVWLRRFAEAELEEPKPGDNVNE